MDYSRALQTAKRAAKEGRKVLEKYYGNIKQIDEKLHAGLVSEADKESEKTIVRVLREDFPEINVLGEEGGLQKTSDSSNMWVIDPLDGTTNYIHMYPYYCISIGLKFDNKVQVGVVEVPLLNRTYWAVRGQGAFVDDRRLRVRQVEQFRDTLLATGFFVSPRVDLDRQTQIFKKCVEQVRGVRRNGSAALELCFVAEGCLDGFWEFGLNPWDTAAGVLLIEEAGGLISNDKGQPFNLEDNGLVVGNKVAHDNILKLLQS